MHPAELAGYALLGIVGGLVSVVFCKALLRLRGRFLRLPPATRIAQPAIGGVIIGALLVWVPEIKGVGYEYVDQALNGGLLPRTMALLCLLKLAATIVSYSSGNAGGIFAPSLYIGAMAGGAVGTAINRVALFPTAEPGAYALVGMGTLFAGIIRAPMTSVFMIFEITQNYQILVPLMVGNLLSFVISRRYQPVPIYQALLRQDNVHLPAPVLSPASAAITAAEIMTAPAAPLAADASAASAWAVVRNDRARAYLVGSRSRLVGVVTREELARACEHGRGSHEVRSLVDPSAPHVHPDHPLDIILERFVASPGLLPVLSREEATRVDGVITADEIVRSVRRRQEGAASSR